MKGHRISSLPIAEFCGMAPRLAAEHGAGRAALMSSVFHARCAVSPASATMAARLTRDELAEVDTWQKPKPWSLPLGAETITLTYEDAEKELPVGLSRELGAAAHEDEHALTVGTLDMAWHYEVEPGLLHAFVCDIKKTRWTSEVDTLQVHAYALAYCALRGCQAYSPGLYIAEEARYVWGETVDLFSFEAAVLGERITYAANAEATYQTGAHCNGCWSRFHCKEHLLPPELASSSLKPFTAEGAVTADNSLVALLLAQRAKDTAELVIANCKAVAQRHGGISDGKKVWRPVIQQGRETVSPKLLRDRMGEDAEQYISRGAEFSSYRWCNK